MRYLIYFSYDGSNFNGYQKQPGKRTIEDEFEKALFNINNKKTGIYASGRTDARVHAKGQTAHFDLDVKITPYKLIRALNAFLPNDIHVFKALEVESNFNARFCVKKKIYEYIVNCGEYNPIERNIVYQYCKELDIDLMKVAIKDLIGEHNFSPFVSKEDKRESYVRTIYDASITRKDDKITFKFVGSGFMKYQVRYMVGTLIKVGNKKITPDYIMKILNEEEYLKFVSIVKPEGLYLTDVKY